jgi:hypothetical protein
VRRYATFFADCPAIPALAEETAAATVQDDAPARRIGCRNRIFAIVNACSNAWNVAVAVSSMALKRNGCGYAIDHLGGLRFGRLTGERSFALESGGHIVHTTCKRASSLLCPTASSISMGCQISRLSVALHQRWPDSRPKGVRPSAVQAPIGLHLITDRHVMRKDCGLRLHWPARCTNITAVSTRLLLTE